MVRIVIIVLLLSMQVFFGVPEYFYGSGQYWLRATTYSFFHANFLHLVINCLAAWTIFQPRYKTSWQQLVTSFLIAVLVYPLSVRPVIGFSNVLYAMLGLRTPPLKSPWWKQHTVIIFLIVTMAMVFIPRFSATTHIAAFLLGMAGAAAKRGWLKLTSDARRYY